MALLFLLFAVDLKNKGVKVTKKMPPVAMLLHATRKQLATFCCQVSKTHTTEFVLTAAVLTSKILAAANFTILHFRHFQQNTDLYSIEYKVHCITVQNKMILTIFTPSYEDIFP